MREVPRISVRVANLGGSRPIAVYDDLEKFVMGIDFSRPPEEITAAMQDFIEESVTSGRWTRNDCRGHQIPATRRDEETRGSHA